MDWGLAKVLDQGGVADELRARRALGDSGAIRTIRTGSTPENRAPARCWERPPTWPPSRPAARSTRSTSGPTSSASARSSARSSRGQPAYAGRTGLELYRMAERAELDDACDRLDACGADAELIALAKCAWPPRRRTGRATRAWSLPTDGLFQGRGAAAAGSRAGPGQGRDPRRRGAEAPDPGRRAGRVGARHRVDRGRRMGLGDPRPAEGRRARRASRSTRPSTPPPEARAGPVGDRRRSDALGPGDRGGAVGPRRCCRGASRARSCATACGLC